MVGGIWETMVTGETSRSPKWYDVEMQPLEYSSLPNYFVLILWACRQEHPSKLCG